MLTLANPVLKPMITRAPMNIPRSFEAAMIAAPTIYRRERGQTGSPMSGLSGNEAHHEDRSTNDGELASKLVTRPRDEGSSDNAREVLRCASNAEQAARGGAEVGVPRRHGLETIEERAICVDEYRRLVSLEYLQAVSEGIWLARGKRGRARLGPESRGGHPDKRLGRRCLEQRIQREKNDSPYPPLKMPKKRRTQ